VCRTRALRRENEAADIFNQCPGQNQIAESGRTIGETVRRSPNEIAQEAPEWLTPLILPEWGKRFSYKIDTSRLGITKQKELVKAIEADGHYLLAAIYAKTTPPVAKALESVATL
jgi:hypothetical protein